jgi:hypothetical protein
MYLIFDCAVVLSFDHLWFYSMFLVFFISIFGHVVSCIIYICKVNRGGFICLRDDQKVVPSIRKATFRDFEGQLSRIVLQMLA